MTRDEAQQKLNSTFAKINSSVDPMHNTLIAQSRDAYAKKWGSKMPAEKEAVLKNSLTQVNNLLLKRGVTKEAIKSAATADISAVDNPIAMLYNLMSILIPNFAYTEVCGVQPMPTKESPIFYPQITANENRNGITKGTALLGSTNWASDNTYTTNKTTGAAEVAGTAVTFTAPEGSMLPNTVEITVSGAANGFTLDDGKGVITPVAGVIVQMCEESGSCRMPTTTDENGEARYTFEEGNFKAQLSEIPDGYTVDDAEAKYAFVDGVATIKLNKQ